MKSEMQTMSVRYHLRAICMILQARMMVWIQGHQQLLVGIAIGFVMATAVFLVKDGQVNIMQYFTPQAAQQQYDAFIPSGTNNDTVDTDIISNSDPGFVFPIDGQDLKFNFSGKGILQNVSVVGFQCSIDASEYFDCPSDFSPTHQPIGEHTLEVRAVGNDSTYDNTPAAFVWSVE